MIGFAILLTLAGCASLPPPTAELDSARQAVARADHVDADQYATENIAQARAFLAQAQAAVSSGREDEARSLALLSAAEADLAHARSREAIANAEAAQRQREIAELQQQLQQGAQP